ncbi:MAG: twin transmembrane helix small protein [Burkholderiales bacterium]|nr:twin transmembrane helix small protein [Burkholderiales bacterium]
MKILITVAFVAILSALAFAGVAMVRGKEGEGKKPTMMHALAWRVGLSVALFLCILISYKLGWIQPTGIQLR